MLSLHRTEHVGSEQLSHLFVASFAIRGLQVLEERLQETHLIASAAARIDQHQKGFAQFYWQHASLEALVQQGSPPSLQVQQIRIIRVLVVVVSSDGFHVCVCVRRGLACDTTCGRSENFVIVLVARKKRAIGQTTAVILSSFGTNNEGQQV